jgi:hypothetical protein
MSTKINLNLLNVQKNLFSNNVKTFTGFYSDSLNTSITSTSANWNSLAINEDGLCFAIQDGSSNVLNYSTDGGNSWTALTVGVSNNWRSITYSQDLSRFVVVGGGTTSYIMYSNKKNPISGSDWIVATNGVPTGNSIVWEDVVYEGGQFVAVANAGSGIIYSFRRILLSRDGINWRLDTPPLNLVNQLNQWKTITYGNGTFVAASKSAVSNSYSKLMYSIDDGNTWTESRSPNSTIIRADVDWQDSCYSPKLNLFIMVANAGTYRLIYSRDGQNWTNDGISASINSLGLTAITWSQQLELFMGISSGSSPGRSITSSDGINWTLRNFSIGNRNAKSIIWNKKHNNFIIAFSGTAGTNNLLNTRPLGINSTLLGSLNKTPLTSFYYSDNDNYIKIGIGVNFGISPTTNVNIHNTYSIDIPLPIGIYLNPKNGVIYGNYSKIETISRKITAYNTVTGESITSNINISFENLKIQIGSFYYYVQSTKETSSTNTFEIRDLNNPFVLIPVVDSISPYAFTINSSLANPYILSFGPTNGVITIYPNRVTNENSFTISVTVFNNYEEASAGIGTTIILTIRVFIRISAIYRDRGLFTTTRKWTRKETRYLYEGEVVFAPGSFIQIFPYDYYNTINFNYYSFIYGPYNELSPVTVSANNKQYTFISIYFRNDTRDPIPPGFYYDDPQYADQPTRVTLYLLISGINSYSEAQTFFSSIEILGVIYPISSFTITPLTGLYLFSLTVGYYPGSDTIVSNIILRY